MTTTGANGLTYQQVLDRLTQLGEEAGKGRDTQIKALLQLVEGGHQGALDTDKNKHGTDIDDAEKLAEAYVRAQSGAVVFDAKAANQRKTISCFRTCIKLGQWPKGGAGEPLGTVNKLMNMRQGLRKNPAQAKKLDDAANVLLKYARQQLKRDQLVDDSELQSMCFRKQPDMRSAEEIVEAARNQLQKLYTGKAAHNTALDNSAEVKSAIQMLTNRLKAIASQKGGAAVTAAVAPPAQAAVPQPPAV
jgi:hypothetical protein